MRVRGIVAEDFSNFKEPAMFIVSAECDWKCCTEIGADVSLCQNSNLVLESVKEIPDSEIVDMYLGNKITKAIVIG